MGAALTGDVAGLTGELGHAKKGEHPVKIATPKRE